MMWKSVNVSVKGTSHEVNNLVCQDCNNYSIVQKDNFGTLIAVVSDGAGSATKAEIGSSFICQKFITDIEKAIETGFSINAFDKDFFKNWIIEFQNELKVQEKVEILSDYACTFLGAIVSEEAACFVQIGDGAIVVKNDEGGYSFIFVPQQGEYVNQTFFVTGKNAVNQFEFNFLKEKFDEIALLSDGIQNLVIDLQNNSTNEDFFSQWFQWLREVENINIGNASLEHYLNSPKINERTDDDKTLILAIRENNLTETEQIL